MRPSPLHLACAPVLALTALAHSQVDCGLPNQTCQTASRITQGLIQSHNLCASTSHYNGSCEMYLDVWHKFTAPYGGLALLSFCQQGGSTAFHSTLAGFRGSCGSLVELSCNRTTCMGRFIRVRQSEIRFPVVAGETYYVAVGSQEASSMGSAYTLRFRIDEYASCTFRNGARINPVGFDCLSPPVIGRTWRAAVETTPATVSTLLALAAAPAKQPFLGGELLVNLSSPTVFLPGTGSYGVAVPASQILIGAALFAQGFRVDLVSGAPTLVALNAQDLVFGLP